MAKKDKNIVKPNYPIMGCDMSVQNIHLPLRRRARFAPQLIADGFREGVSQEQGNLLKSAFDEPNSDKVDPFTNIHSDKFDLMKSDVESPSADPVPNQE